MPHTPGHNGYGGNAPRRRSTRGNMTMGSNAAQRNTMGSMPRRQRAVRTTPPGSTNPRTRASRQLEMGERFNGQPRSRYTAGTNGVRSVGGNAGKQKRMHAQQKIRQSRAGQQLRGIPNNYVFVSKQNNDGTTSKVYCPPGQHYISKDCVTKSGTDKTTQQVINTNYLHDPMANERRY
jgi:hypothetical protein